MSGPKRVLLVDDDRTLQALLAEQLEATKEFATTCVNDGKAALDIVQRELFDLILLDVGLPDLDGREVCRELRRQNVRTPVIMLTAADSDADTIHGLEAGANDYVSKPFKMGVLLARSRAQLRQFEQSEDAVFAIGPYSFRPANKLLLDNEKAGKKVRLTEKETAILKYLLRAGQKPVPRETLLTEVWGYNAGVSTHTLETHVYRLRQKIERNPAEARLLLTEPGGYRLSP
ncbi:response regulator transcription factor [Ferrovibrio sp.]|uniref:response regulator transcription factor n=1 Tax=Ferrovibrio sp. TaxID=1917215 RepID=UPI003D0F13DD